MSEILPFTQASFQRYLNQKNLMGSRCLDCGNLYLPPRAICPACFSDRMEWIAMPTRGRLAAFTAIYVPTTVMASQGFSREKPYVAGIVALENGLRISAQIIGLGEKGPTALAIGNPLVIDFINSQPDEIDCQLAFRPEAP